MNELEEQFLKCMGFTASEWDELKRSKMMLKCNMVEDILQENARLRGKVAFYESQIKRLNDFEKNNREARLP